MAEAVVSFVIERVGDLLIQESKFLASVHGQVEGMQTELKRMQSFLKEVDKRQEFDGNLQRRVSEIRDIAYHVENVIETFALKIASRREQGFTKTCKRYATIFIEGAMLHKLGEDIEAIKTKIADYTASLQRYQPEPKEDDQVSVLKTQRELRRTYSHLVEDHTVGLGEDTMNLVAKLIQEDRSQCQVVTICGMGGMGKTTLANKLYHHGDIRRHFDGFAWAYASQEFRARDVWECILIQLISKKRENIINMRDEEIAKKLYQVQLEKKCLVVLDDIWREEAWDALKPAFPIRKAFGRLVLTTRNKAVASHVDPTSLYQPRLLTYEESWELLQKRAFPQENSPDSRIDKVMEKLGREMVGRCGGLPLAIIVLGGLLAKNYNLNEWKKVHKNFDVNIRRGKLQNEQGYLGIEWILALSYRELPYRFKPCFLYLGHFPEDYEIQTTKLFKLWLAEGLVSKMEYEVGGKETTLEDIAESYLGELIDRCMVQVGKMGSTNKVKTIRLHDLMRDLCLSKGYHEQFLNIVQWDRNHQVVSHSATSPRLAVYNDDEIFDETTFDLKNPHLRSLLFFTKIIYYDDGPKMIWTSSNFKFLKVLILDHCEIKKKSAEEIGNLVHLRYLCFQDCKMEILPESIGNLRYLQTLSVSRSDLNSNSIMVSNVIWKLANLRHLDLRDLDTTGRLRRVGNLKSLQTLGNINMRDIDVHDLLKLTNLKKLLLSQLESLSDLEIILQQPSVAFNCLCALFIGSTIFKETDLKRLFSCCRNLYKLRLYGQIEKLPEYQDFPPNLTKLTLSGSKLKEDPMATLNKLPHLSILFLYFNAYTGKKMVCSSGGFPHLKALHLSLLQNLEEWWVDEGAFPSLSLLRINYCDKLKMVPDGLRFITTLREMQIIGMLEKFSKRLRVVNEGGEGGEDLHKVQHVPSIIVKFSNS